MIDTRKAYGKLHLILDLIDRKDLRQELDEKFTKEEQENIFELFRSIMTDEMRFVIQIKEAEKQNTSH